jgi:hypothetical protein
LPHRYCYLPLSWKSWNLFECAVGGVRVYWNILTMHVPINVKSSHNISQWQMGFNSAFKGLRIAIDSDSAHMPLMLLCICCMGAGGCKESKVGSFLPWTSANQIKIMEVEKWRNTCNVDAKNERYSYSIKCVMNTWVFNDFLSRNALMYFEVA